MLVPDAPVMIRGRVSMRDEEEPKIICDTIEHIHVENSITDKLFIRLNESDTNLERKVMEYCEQMTPVVRPQFTEVDEDGLTFVSAEIPLVLAICLLMLVRLF
jgi:hypothetical protein